MSMPATSTKTTKLATSLIDEYALLGWRAMLTEVNLSPKPGLVDRINCGAHKDMALEDFHRSALAIQGWLPRFIEFGACSAEMAPEAVLNGLRPIGMACEGDMFRACIDSLEVRKKPGGHWIIRDLMGLDLVGLASL